MRHQEFYTRSCSVNNNSKHRTQRRNAIHGTIPTTLDPSGRCIDITRERIFPQRILQEARQCLDESPLGRRRSLFFLRPHRHHRNGPFGRGLAGPRQAPHGQRVELLFQQLAFQVGLLGFLDGRVGDHRTQFLQLVLELLGERPHFLAGGDIDGRRDVRLFLKGHQGRGPGLAKVFLELDSHALHVHKALDGLHAVAVFLQEFPEGL
mmetsp:Transcript_12156/g.28531  ORF Transcript_12156/g.28531 Transcript_12156/m.28531 type:complete len:207 (-) Transcript_12156:2490-3110(-)